MYKLTRQLTTLRLITNNYNWWQATGNRRLKIKELLIEELNYGAKEETIKELEKIHSQRKSPDPPGSFGFKRARRTNKRIDQEILLHLKVNKFTSRCNHIEYERSDRLCPII